MRAKPNLPLCFHVLSQAVKMEGLSANFEVVGKINAFKNECCELFRKAGEA